MVSDRLNRIAAMLLVGSLAGAVTPALAMTALSERELSDVAGRDGLTAIIDDGAAGWSADRFKWTSDPGTANQGALSTNDMALNTLGATDFEVNLDLYTHSSGTPGGRLELLWDELALEIGGIYTYDSADTQSAFSGGEIGFFSSGGFTLVNQGGLFNANATDTEFDLRFSTPSQPGDFILRQGGPGSPEFSFADANLTLTTTNCTVNNCTLGINSSGPFLSADTVNLDLNFDIRFKNAPTDFDRTGRDDLIKFGWTGGLSNFLMQMDGTGITGSGLTFDVEFDYQSDFTLILGQAGIENARAEFKGYESLGTHADPIFRMPVTFDAVAAGTALEGLCFGNVPGCTPTANEELVNLAVNQQALGVYIRDGHMWGYNTQVDVVDPSATGDPTIIDEPGDRDSFNWSLGFAFGRIDSNIMLYPGYDSNDDGTFDSTGMTSDVVLTVSSPGYWHKRQTEDPTAGANWATNSHFFIADTLTAIDVNNADGDGNFNTGTGDRFAFGVLNSDLVWSADNMAIRVASDADTAFGIDFPGGLWLQSGDNVRYHFRGALGGGDLADLTDLVQISTIDVRLDTDQFVFALSPVDASVPSGGTRPAIAFDALLDFNGNSYMALAEPSNPNAEMSVANVSGRIMWRNGKVQLLSQADTGTGRPELKISNDLLIGGTASGGAPLRGDVFLGTERLGEVVIPTGKFYSSIALKPQ